jgi:hypothetical protein
MKAERQISILLLISSISILGGEMSTPSLVYAESQTDSNILNFLFVQHSESGSISKINSTTYSLQLNDLADNVFLFSDRPERIVDTQSIEEFVGNWTLGADSFQDDPPNAALGFLDDDNQKLDTVVIELFNPKYEKDQNTLKYDFSFLDNSIAASFPDLPYKTGQSILVIDAIAKFKAHGCEHGDPGCA